MKPRTAHKTTNPGRKSAAKSPVLIEKLVERVFPTRSEADRFKTAMARYGVTDFNEVESKTGISLIFRTRAPKAD